MSSSNPATQTIKAALDPTKQDILSTLREIMLDKTASAADRMAAADRLIQLRDRGIF